ncbi:cytochrome P450 [Streptomyces sp. SBT349]|uniref:cytochrome P450 n=1 Tax=Streptomyces sp. SBT349 TaxID=1580539 RepID=UPI00066C2DFF|nr:cytochrome P450 [Streptomyces sp. SBT349]
MADVSNGSGGSDGSDGVLPCPLPGSFRFEPSPLWARLRETSPVVRVRTVSGHVSWLVTRYEDARTVLSDKRFSRARMIAPDAPQAGLTKPRRGSLPTMDPPEHTRVRRLLTAEFSHRYLEGLRPWIRDLAERLADDLAAAEAPADVRELFCQPVPIQVICQILGVPYEDRRRFAAWSAGVYGLSPDEADSANESYDRLEDYLGRLLAAKRAGLRKGRAPEDLLDRLVSGSDEHRHLDEEQLVAFGLNLLIGGFETTANQLGTFVASLLSSPDEWRRLAADEELVPAAVEELLRLHRLSETGQLRIATEDVELSGTRIGAGEGVIAAIGAANRDPRAFPDPDRLDITRTPNPHLAFGHGPHFCLGAHLARIELQEALRTLTRRFPGMRLAVPAAELSWRRALISGLENIPVLCGPGQRND